MKLPSLPDWSQSRVTMDSSGSKWYKDPDCFWYFRAIHRPAGLDYVPDRGGFVEGRMTDENKAFIVSVLDSQTFADWVAQQSGSSREIFCADGNNYHLRASNNASYGYTYLWAWQEETK